MSSELAKGLLIASCVIVVVSAGFMTFSTPKNTSAADLDVYVKCQACGEAKIYSSEDFTELAREQFNELKSSDPDLVDEIIGEFTAVSSGYGMRPEMTTGTSDTRAEKMIILSWGSMIKDIPMKCEKCGAYECFGAFKCKKCGEICVIENPQDRSTKTCSKCRGEL